jgi:hypothetical protein
LLGYFRTSRGRIFQFASLIDWMAMKLLPYVRWKRSHLLLFIEILPNIPQSGPNAGPPDMPCILVLLPLLSLDSILAWSATLINKNAISSMI